MSDKELDQMTEEELDALAAKQRARIQGSESDLRAAGRLTKQAAKGAAIAAGLRKPDDMRNALKWGRNMGYPRPEKPWPFSWTWRRPVFFQSRLGPSAFFLGPCSGLVQEDWTWAQGSPSDQNH